MANKYLQKSICAKYSVTNEFILFILGLNRMHKTRNSYPKESPHNDTHNCCLLDAFIKINGSDNEILFGPLIKKTN